MKRLNQASFFFKDYDKAKEFGSKVAELEICSHGFMSTVPNGFAVIFIATNQKRVKVLTTDTIPGMIATKFVIPEIDLNKFAVNSITLLTKLDQLI